MQRFWRSRLRSSRMSLRGARQPPKPAESVSLRIQQLCGPPRVLQFYRPYNRPTLKPMSPCHWHLAAAQSLPLRSVSVAWGMRKRQRSADALRSRRKRCSHRAQRRHRAVRGLPPSDGRHHASAWSSPRWYTHKGRQVLVMSLAHVTRHQHTGTLGGDAASRLGWHRS